MKRTLAVLVLMFVCATAHALDIDPFRGPKPIAVLLQTDPWLMVIGSDTPMVAIYEDGQVLYLKRAPKKDPVLLVAHLSQKALTNITQKLSSFGDYSKVKRHYNLAPNVTDLPETRIYLSIGNTKLVTSIYGLKVSDTHLPAYSTFPGHQRPDDLPKAVKELHAFLTTMDFADAKPWKPQYIEVMIWPYDYAPDKSIHWPRDWPGLDSPNTLKRRDAYSIFLPGSDFPRLRGFLKTQKEKGAVEIGGRKWAVSVRYTFPSEPIWSNAFKGKD